MKFVRVLIAVTLAAVLAACGGGGGSNGSAPAVVVPTTTTPPAEQKQCPNGIYVTDVAECATAKVLSTSLVQGDVISPDVLAAITVNVDSALKPESLTADNIRLWAGAADVPGNLVKATVTSTARSFTLTFASKLNFGQDPYIFHAEVEDALGRPIVVGIKFSTTARVCLNLTVWEPGLAVPTCVAPQGVQIVGASQMTDTACTADQWGWDKPCFRNAVGNGTVSVFTSSALANGKPLVFTAFYDVNKKPVLLAFTAEDVKNPVPIGGNLIGLVPSATTFNWLIANPTGPRIDFVGLGTFQFQFNDVSNQFVVTG